jgi:hypothetical protein
MDEAGSLLGRNHANTVGNTHVESGQETLATRQAERF